MSWHFDDKPILAQLFLGCLDRFSSDVQRVILDYLCYRIIQEFEKDGLKSFLRLGPIMIGQRVAYEIKVYNKDEQHSLASTALRDYQRIIDLFKYFEKRFIVCNDEWVNCLYMDTLRYAFSPTNGLTYIVSDIGYGGVSIHYANTIQTVYYIKSSTKRKDIIMELINIYSKLIERYGDQWHLYPPRLGAKVIEQQGKRVGIDMIGLTEETSSSA